MSLTYLNFLKNFDMFSRGILVSKLRYTGLKGGLFGKYPHSQRVVVSGSMSRSRAGVHQGSVLGPVLFKIFSNDTLSKLAQS